MVFLSNYLVFKIVLAALGRVDYPVAGDLELKYDNANKIYLSGGSLEYVDDATLYTTIGGETISHGLLPSLTGTGAVPPLIKTIVGGDTNYFVGGGYGGPRSFNMSNGGTVLVAGAEGYNTNQGLIYIYEREAKNRGEWKLKQTIYGNLGTNANFGKTVSINDVGDRIFVGADYYPGGNQTGRVLVYDRGSNGLFPDTPTHTLTGSNGNGYVFGWAIDCNGAGDKLIVGARNEPNSNQRGAHHLYELSGGTWTRTYHRVEGSSNRRYGWAVAMNKKGDRFVVSGSYPGGWIWIFHNENGSWVQKTQISNPSNGEFGWSVAMNDVGDRIAVGTNTTNVYIYDYSGTSWSLFTSKTDNTSGYALASLTPRGDYIAIHNPYSDPFGSDTGAAYIYKISDTGTLTLIQPLTTTTPLANTFTGEASSDNFGWHVYMSDDLADVVMGAKGNDEGGSYSGKLYVYGLDGKLCENTYITDAGKYSVDATIAGLNYKTNELDITSLTIPTKVVQVSTGDDASGVLTQDGFVYMWGLDNNSTLGQGTDGVPKNTPVKVKGVGGTGYLGNIIKITRASYATLALASDGTLYAWGNNDYGIIGNGTSGQGNHPLTPVEVSYSGDPISKISGGRLHAGLVTTTGKVYCWGQGTNGQVGDNSTTQRNIPTQVVGVGNSGTLAGIRDVTCGDSFTHAIKDSDGSVYAWGKNTYGMLGDGTTTNRTTPVPVILASDSSAVTGIIQISSGGDFALFLKSDGTVYSCGYGASGQLGDGGTANNDTGLVQVLGVGGSGNLTGITQIATCDSTSLALKSDGTMYSWGNNSDGQNGLGTVGGTNPTTPVAITTLTGVNAIAGEGRPNHFIASKPDGSIYCWGRGASGQIGDGTNTADQGTPTQVLAGAGPSIGGKFNLITEPRLTFDGSNKLSLLHGLSSVSSKLFLGSNVYDIGTLTSDLTIETPGLYRGLVFDTSSNVAYFNKTTVSGDITPDLSLSENIVSINKFTTTNASEMFGHADAKNHAFSKDKSIFVTSSDTADGNSGNGKVFIYKRGSDGTYALDTTLTAVTGGTNNFGHSLDINDTGTRLVISEPEISWTNGEGRIHVYDRVSTSASWPSTPTTTLNTSTDTGSHKGFGYDLALSGDGNTIGTSTYGGGSYNRAYIFEYSSSSWTETKTWSLGGSTDIGASCDLSHDGTRFVIGAFGASGTKWYSFHKTGSTWAASATEHTLVSSSRANIRISGNGNVVFVGTESDSSCEIWEYGSSWSRTTTLTQTTNFGCSMASNYAGTIFAIGESSHNSSQGRVFIYSKSGSTITLIKTLVNPDAGGSQWFGTTGGLEIDYYGHILAVNASGYNSSKGKVQLFENPAVPSLTFDMYNKLSLSGITNPTSKIHALPTGAESTTTYDIGSATNIYIESAGTYSAEMKGSDGFALDSNVVGTVDATISITAFHYGAFSASDYSSAYSTVGAAATAGHVYSDTTPATYTWGTLNSVDTSTTGQTGYSWTPTRTITADVLMVAGGGGGGGYGGGGGGGAGGLLYHTNQSLSGTKTIVVGNGGVGGLAALGDTGKGSTGSDTELSGLTTAAGGGGGGSHSSTQGSQTERGKDGGSGGGGGHYLNAGQGYNGYGGSAVPSGQGFAGGNTGINTGGGGGGGSGGVGFLGPNGNGGIGTDKSSIFGTIYGDSGWFASGGGGAGRLNQGNSNYGTASNGGGSDGTNDNLPTAAQKHTGGGGGGSGEGTQNTSAISGGHGGSGIVLIRSGPSAAPSLTFDGFNKYTFTGADTGSTYKLKYESNTYDLGTISNVYIANPGTYSSEIKGATNFALSSNVTSGTITPYKTIIETQTIYGASSNEQLGWMDNEGSGTMCFNKDGTKLALSSYQAKKVYVYTLTNGTYVLDSGTPLTNSNFYFGYTCSLNDDGTLLAVNHTGGSNQQTGDTYVYQYSSGSWSLRATFGGGLYYTKSNVLDGVGNRVLSSASGTNTMKIYDWNGSTYAESQSFSGSNAFANGMDMTRDGLIVGGVDKTTNNTVKVWQYSGSSWSQMGGDVSVGNVSPFFRLNRVGGTRFIVSSAYDDTAFTDAGIVKVYDYAGGSWTNTKTFYGDSASSGLGTSINISDDGKVIISGGSTDDTKSTDAGVFYEFKETNGVWETKKFYDNVAGARFGSGIAMNSTASVYAIGAGYDDTIASNAGKVLIYKEKNVLDFDGYNKLTLSGLESGSTSNVLFNGNTYSIGTASNVYIENTGTYDVESKGTTTFALTSNVVGAIQTHPDAAYANYRSIGAISAASSSLHNENITTTYSVTMWAKKINGNYFFRTTPTDGNSAPYSTHGILRWAGSKISHITWTSNSSTGITYATTLDATSKDEWHFYGFEFEGTTTKLHLDGASPITGTTGLNGQTHNRIRFDDPTVFSTGGARLAEFAVYNRALTDAEFVSIYNNGKPNGPDNVSSGRVSWFKCLSGAMATNSGSGGDFDTTITEDVDVPSSWKYTPPSLTHDGYKLVVSGITPTSTTLKYFSNTYETGSATNIYVKDTGAYTAEIGGATDFVFTSNTVSGTIKTVEPALRGGFRSGHALTYDGKLYAWGRNTLGTGELGVGDTTDKSVPTLCTGITQGQVEKFLDTDVNAPKTMTWIKTTDNKIHVTGNASQNQIPGHTTDLNTFTDITSHFGDQSLSSNNIIQVSFGGSACAGLTETGNVWTWGQNSNALGDLGNGGTTSSTQAVPAQITFSSATDNITKLANGHNFTIALDNTGDVWLWGTEYIESTWGSVTPIKMGTTLDSVTITDISASYSSMYAISNTGVLYASGGNSVGQIMDGSQTDVTSSSNPDWKEVTYFSSNLITVNKVYPGTQYESGGFVDTSDGWYAFGNNFRGNLGLGDTSNKLSPVKFTGVSNIKKFAVGYDASHAVTEDGKYYAWGGGTNYARGDNNTGDITYPKHIDTLPNILAPSFDFDGYDKISSYDTEILRKVSFQGFTYSGLTCNEMQTLTQYNGAWNAWLWEFVEGGGDDPYPAASYDRPNGTRGQAKEWYKSANDWRILRTSNGYKLEKLSGGTWASPSGYHVQTADTFQPDANGIVTITFNWSSHTGVMFKEPLYKNGVDFSTKFTKGTTTYDAGKASIITVPDPGTYDAQLSKGDFSLKSATVPATKASGLYTWAFHHGNFDNAYGDGDILTARDNGRFYADTPAYTGTIGTITAIVPPSSFVYEIYIAVKSGGYSAYEGIYWQELSSSTMTLSTSMLVMNTAYAVGGTNYSAGTSVVGGLFDGSTGTGNRVDLQDPNVEVGQKIATLTTSQELANLTFTTQRPGYMPGWKIVLNGTTILEDSANNGTSGSPSPFSITKTLPVNANTTYTFAPPSGGLTANVMMVAGGGGGGGRYHAGGGGAGGLVYTAGTSLAQGATKTIVVGNGDSGGNATGSPYDNGFNGKNTTFTGLDNAVGGGGGGANYTAANSGGSGGGGGASQTSGTPNAGGSGTANQGNVGGVGITAASGQPGTNRSGGGGGGAGGVGILGVSGSVSGGGGIGKFFGTGSSFTNFGNEYGEAGYFSGGGGGGVYHSGRPQGIPGRGGGGYGANEYGYMGVGGSQHALPHTGGGGGGSGMGETTDKHPGYASTGDGGVTGHGGRGGSGIVLIQTNVAPPNGSNTAVVQVGNPRRRSLPPTVSAMGSEVNRWYIIDSASMPTYKLPTHWYTDPISSNSNHVFTTQGSHSLQKRADGGTSNVWYASSAQYFADYGTKMAQSADAIFMPVEAQRYSVLLSIGQNNTHDIQLEMAADGTAKLYGNNGATLIIAGTIKCFTVGKWHHIALTVDSEHNAVGYVNGHPVISTTYTSHYDVGTRSGNMHMRVGVGSITFRKFLTYEVSTYNFHMSPKQVLQRAAEVGLGPKLEYDGLNTIKILNTEPGSTVKLFTSNVEDTSNVFIVADPAAGEYTVPEAGKYYAEIKGTDTFTITRTLDVSGTFPLYAYPPRDGTHSSITTTQTVNQWDTWTISGASNGNGQYQARSNHQNPSATRTSYSAFKNDITPGAGEHNMGAITGTRHLDLQLPSAKTIRKYIIWLTDSAFYTGNATTTYTQYDPVGTMAYNGNERGVRRIKSWTIQGSNNDSDWTTIHTVTNKPPSNFGDLHTISSPGSYQYYRIAVTEHMGSSQNTMIGELIYYGD